MPGQECLSVWMGISSTTHKMAWDILQVGTLEFTFSVIYLAPHPLFDRVESSQRQLHKDEDHPESHDKEGDIAVDGLVGEVVEAKKTKNDQISWPHLLNLG